MEKTGDRIAQYQITTDADGNHYRFFCDLSGVMVCKTKPIRADTQEEELRIAWETEGKKMFNQCHKCGRWVSNVMYNADALECVDCTPWEEDLTLASMEHYGFGTKAMKKVKKCDNCGMMAPASEQFCRECGTRLPEDTLYQFYKGRVKNKGG